MSKWIPIVLLALCACVTPSTTEEWRHEVALVRGDVQAAAALFDDEDIVERANQLAEALGYVEAALGEGGDVKGAVALARTLIDELIEDAGDRQDWKAALFLAERVLARIDIPEPPQG